MPAMLQSTSLDTQALNRISQTRLFTPSIYSSTICLTHVCFCCPHLSNRDAVGVVVAVGQVVLKSGPQRCVEGIGALDG